MTEFSARKRKLTRKFSAIFHSCIETVQLTSGKTSFASFFNHIDHFPQEEFLYVTSGGIPAAKPTTQPSAATEDAQKGRKSQREALAEIEAESEDEGNLPNNGEEGG